MPRLPTQRVTPCESSRFTRARRPPARRVAGAARGAPERATLALLRHSLTVLPGTVSGYEKSDIRTTRSHNSPASRYAVGWTTPLPGTSTVGSLQGMFFEIHGTFSSQWRSLGKTSKKTLSPVGSLFEGWPVLQCIDRIELRLEHSGARRQLFDEGVPMSHQEPACRAQ
jgi:hypothetical protein